jgi:hypothetical protein
MFQDFEQKIKDLETENTRLRAQCRLLDMKLETLENDVEQKAKENSQLNALCNELISGKGGQDYILQIQQYHLIEFNIISCKLLFLALPSLRNVINDTFL